MAKASIEPHPVAAASGGDAAPSDAPAAPTRQYRTQEVVDALGVTRRQLQYWAKTGLVRPSATTPGGHHRYSFADLVAVKAARRLIDAGVSVQRIRRCLEALAQRLPQIDRPLEQLVIVATGDVLLVIDGESAFEALSGQEWIFEVAQLARDLATWERGSGARRTAPATSQDVRAEPVRRARAVRRAQRQQRSAS